MRTSSRHGSHNSATPPPSSAASRSRYHFSPSPPQVATLFFARLICYGWIFSVQANPDNTVGVLAMASGGRPSSGANILVSPTNDFDKVLACMRGKENLSPHVGLVYLLFQLVHRSHSGCCNCNVQPDVAVLICLQCCLLLLIIAFLITYSNMAMPLVVHLCSGLYILRSWLLKFRHHEQPN
jgi:hypothetical protein